jgi:drug/metabolite transporter (DMT)-like permease
MQNTRTRFDIITAFAVIYVAWGTTYISLAFALQTIPPFLLMASRCLIGGAILLTAARATDGALPALKTWPLATVCGQFFFVGCHGVLAYAQQRVPSGLAAILLATIPLWISLLNFLVPSGARPGLKGVILLSPGVIGVSLITGREVTGGAHTSVGDLILILGAALSWATGTIISGRRSQKSSPMAFSGVELCAGGVTLSVISILTGELSRFRMINLSAVSIAGWTYLTLIGTVIAFSTYVWLLRKVEASVVATYTFVNPIIAVLVGWVFLGERPSLWTLTGAAMVITSIVGVLVRSGNRQFNEGEHLHRCRNHLRARS